VGHEHAIERRRGEDVLHLVEPRQPGLTVCLKLTGRMAAHTTANVVRLCAACVAFRRNNETNGPWPH